MDEELENQSGGTNGSTEEVYYYFYRNKAILKYDVWMDPQDYPLLQQLTDNQVNFYLAHPDASIWEVRNCQLYPTPPEPTPIPIEDIRASAIRDIDEYSRATLGKTVDTLEFCNALAGTIYASKRGISSIYDDDKILATADEFLTKGRLCREEYLNVVNLINAATTEDQINSIVDTAKLYYDSLLVVDDTLELHKQLKLREIDVYDVSDNVNGFFYNGILMWLDRETRTSLANTLNSAEMIGRDNINIWFSGHCLALHITVARQLLAALEIYATDCYNVTAQHKVQVNALTTIEEVDAFDVTADYPDRPEFNDQGRSN